MISVWVMNFCRHRSIRFCTLLMSFQETLASSSALLLLAAAAAEGAAATTTFETTPPPPPPSPAPPPALLLGFSFAAPAGGACGCGGAACGMAPGSCTGATSMAGVGSASWLCQPRLSFALTPTRQDRKWWLLADVSLLPPPLSCVWFGSGVLHPFCTHLYRERYQPLCWRRGLRMMGSKDDRYVRSGAP